MRVKGREALGLDKSDLEVVDLLASLGLDPRQAKVLTYLAHVEEGKSSEIERGCRLRQPEVSVATKDLRTMGWIAAEERRRGGKGRPVHYYKLASPFPSILDAIESKKRVEIENELEKIERLKSLVTPPDTP